MDIYLIHGGKLDKSWNIPVVFKEGDPIGVDLVNSYMNIYDGEDVLETLAGGVGLGVTTNSVSGVQVNAFILDTSFMPKKNLAFDLMIKSSGGDEIFSDKGTIYVVESSNVDASKEARPWDLINPEISHVSREERKARLDICRSCPRLKAGICLECGCVMNLKTKLPHASCPIHKW